MWDILVAGRVAQLRRAPRPFAAITAIAGLLLLPALIVAYSSASILYGRAIQPIAWIWPLVTVLFALQAAYALSRRLVTPLFGVPVAVYNVIVAIVAVTRFVVARGGTPPEFCLALSAAQANSLGLFFGPAALWGAAYLLVPVFSPSLKARWRISGAVRGIIAALVGGIAALILILMPSAFREHPQLLALRQRNSSRSIRKETSISDSRSFPTSKVRLRHWRSTRTSSSRIHSTSTPCRLSSMRRARVSQLSTRWREPSMISERTARSSSSRWDIPATPPGSFARMKPSTRKSDWRMWTALPGGYGRTFSSLPSSLMARGRSLSGFSHRSTGLTTSPGRRPSRIT